MVSNSKKVTIIVPIYNGEQYIAKCVDSLLGQTYASLEIILVNDGSKDGTLDVCKKYEKNNSNIILIDKENEGVTIARQAGVGIATGEYISFVDVDDWVEEDFIENMMNELADADIIFAGISRVHAEEDFRIEEEKNNMSPGVYSTGKSFEKFLAGVLRYDMPFKMGILPYACNKIYKKEILLPILMNVDKHIYNGEDVAVIFPYILQAHKIVLSDYCGYKYLIHKNSLSNQKRVEAYDNASRLYIWLYDAFVKSVYKDILLPQLRDYYLRMIWKSEPAVYIEANEFVFPFEKVKCGSKVILYGAGDVGRAYYMQAKQTNYCQIAAWADKNVEYCAGMQCDLIKPEQIMDRDYDYVIVAIRSAYICNQVFEYLAGMGVLKDKIILYNTGVIGNDGQIME